MDLARPYAAVASGLEGDVLVVLARSSTPLTGRQIARLAARGSSPSVSAALDRLVTQGLVLREEAGRAYLHVLNRQHVAAPAVEILASLRGELLRRLRSSIATWETPPRHASLFGSAARGEGSAASDLDMLIVRPTGIDDRHDGWRRQLADLAEAARAWSGNVASMLEVDERELRRWRRQPPAALVSAQQEGLLLGGVPLSDLMRGRS